MRFHVSTQAGVVRQTERHLATDPPSPTSSQRSPTTSRAIFAERRPAEVRARARARRSPSPAPRPRWRAIDLELEPYDPARVHGHAAVRWPRAGGSSRAWPRCPRHERRDVAGLHPDRAPTIVAGVVMLIEALELFGLDSTEVSDHDILRGAALDVVHRDRPNGEVNPPS